MTPSVSFIVLTVVNNLILSIALAKEGTHLVEHKILFLSSRTIHFIASFVHPQLPWFSDLFVRMYPC